MTARSMVAELAREVAAMTPVDDRHVASIAELLAGLQQLRAPFDEHAAATHVTSSAIVLGPRGTVLHRHKRLGLWLQPGGHIHPGESPPDAALRETREETGLAVRHPPAGPHLIHVDAHPGGRGHRHLDLRYLLVNDGDDPSPPQGESQDVRWFSVTEAVAIADDGLVGALHALAGRRWTGAMRNA